MRGKVLLLGFGSVGRVIARYLGKIPSVSEVLIGDIVVEPVKEAIRELGDKFTAEKIDAGDFSEVKKAMKGFDVVINASLPDFNETVMKAAIENRTNYIDLVVSEFEKQFSYSDAFKDAGIVGILGMGFCPGVSNILVKKAAYQLDEVDKVIIRVCGSGEKFIDYPITPLFEPKTFLEEWLLRTPIVYRDGKYQTLPRFSGEEVYNFPEPIGPRKIYNIYHDELETLPKYLGKKMNVLEWKYSLVPEVKEALEFLIKLGFAERKTIRVKGVEISPLECIAALIPRPSELAGKIKGYVCLDLEVLGTYKGEYGRLHSYVIFGHEEAYKAAKVNATGYLTGIPAALGAKIVVEGKVGIKGIIPPEMLDPEVFINELKSYNYPLYEEPFKRT